MGEEKRIFTRNRIVREMRDFKGVGKKWKREIETEKEVIGIEEMVLL